MCKCIVAVSEDLSNQCFVVHKLRTKMPPNGKKKEHKHKRANLEN